MGDMDAKKPVPLSGRKVQAARNDRLILDAAREVFTADPSAPVSDVAERAGVGISALYRRYASKEDLLRRLCAEGLGIYIAAAEDALADEGDPWNAFPNRRTESRSCEGPGTERAAFRPHQGRRRHSLQHRDG